MFKVTGSRSNVDPGSDHGVAQLDHGRNMCAKFGLPPAYGHRDLAWTKYIRFYMFKVTGSWSQVEQLDYGRTKWKPPTPIHPSAHPAEIKTIPTQ